jgi:chorismate mutase
MVSILEKTMAIEPLENWGLNLKRPMVIAGPCSAETEQQMMDTILALPPDYVHILRAGIWKPRTRPGSFEGVGSVGLKWLKKAGDAIGKPVCVEVANVKHVYEALKNNIDILWIGARTTTNPFAVQEIADALQGVDIPVMVKNPVNPDLELWIGAVERIYKAGISRILAIHRGFSTYDTSRYRNKPHWEIPIELRRRIPSLPILCDPSHICGNREMLQHVSQKALDLNFHGLMIETHISPDEALSDARQQVTPGRLHEMLRALVLRNPQTDNPGFLDKLDSLRDSIDELDLQIISRLANRMQLARKIGQYKNENNITILQPERWDEIFRSRVSEGCKLELTETFMVALMQQIHNESIRQQEAVMNED